MSQKIKMTWAEVCARRLARHGLAEPVAPEKLVEQVSMMAGVHAQIITAAELSIGVRVQDASRAAVQDALWKTNTLIKTYGPRGTVHLLPASELAMWIGALSAVPLIRSQKITGRLMNAEQTEQVIDAIGRVLVDTELDIDELTGAIVAETGAWAGDPVMEAFQGKWPRWREAMDFAAHRGVLCFGPNRGNKVTYTSPRRWLPDFVPQASETALPELVKRYLYAYGPATPQHFARWLSTQPARGVALFNKMADELQEVEVDGNTAWVVKGDTEVPDTPPRGVRLLPYFDAYVVGSYPRESVYPGKAFERATARGQAGNFPVLLVDGVVAGVWHQKRAGKKIDITVEPLHDLTSSQRRALDEQVELIGAFLEGTPKLTIGPVTVGAHA